MSGLPTPTGYPRRLEVRQDFPSGVFLVRIDDVERAYFNPLEAMGLAGTLIEPRLIPGPDDQKHWC